MSGGGHCGLVRFIENRHISTLLFFEKDDSGGSVHDSTIKFSDSAVFAKNRQQCVRFTEFLGSLACQESKAVFTSDGKNGLVDKNLSASVAFIPFAVACLTQSIVEDFHKRFISGFHFISSKLFRHNTPTSFSKFRVNRV